MDDTKKVLSKHEFKRNKEREERLRQGKGINEVDALRDVFYNFFEMKNEQGDTKGKETVLISMQVAEMSLNPFLDSDEMMISSDDSDDCVVREKTS